MRKYYWAILLTVFILTLIAAYWWFYFEPKRKIASENQKVVANVIARLEDVWRYPTCATKYFVNPAFNPKPICNSVLFWHQDGHNIGIHNSRVEYVLYSSDFSLDFNNFKNKISQFFSENRFVIDPEASQVIDSWGTGDQRDYFFAFKRDGLYCSIVLPQLFSTGRSAHIPAYIEVSCGQKNSTDESVYREFETIANPWDDASLFFWLEAREGNFVRLGIFNREVQSALLLRKYNGQWVSPFQLSLDYQRCDDLDRLGFPKSVYKNCLLPDASVRYKE